MTTAPLGGSRIRSFWRLGSPIRSNEAGRRSLFSWVHGWLLASVCALQIRSPFHGALDVNFTGIPSCHHAVRLHYSQFDPLLVKLRVWLRRGVPGSPAMRLLLMRVMVLTSGNHHRNPRIAVTSARQEDRMNYKRQTTMKAPNHVDPLQAPGIIILEWGSGTTAYELERWNIPRESTFACFSPTQCGLLVVAQTLLLAQLLSCRLPKFSLSGMPLAGSQEKHITLLLCLCAASCWGSRPMRRNLAGWGRSRPLQRSAIPVGLG